MGILDFVAEMLSINEVHADEQKEEKEEEPQEETEEKSEEEPAEEDAAEEEEEEEEEEEPEDPKPALEEECANSKECHSYKHHYDECVERVTKKQEENEDGKADEDCVEEFFHLAHCASNCAAPKLFKILK